MPTKKPLFSFLYLNFLLSSLLFVFYLFFTNFGARELLFLVPALFSSVFLVYLPLSAAAFLLNLAPKAGKYALILLFSLLHLSTVTDLSIYKVFKYHINAMVLNLIFTPGGLESLDQGTGMKIFAFLLTLSVFALEFYFWRLSAKFEPKKTRLLFSALLFCLLTEKALSAAAVSLDLVWVTKNMKVYPFYQPLKMRSFAEKHFGLKADRSRITTPLGEDSSLNYPLAPLKLEKREKTPNVVMIVIDSARFDMLDPEIMPETDDFARKKKAFVFRNHYSGGNATRFGIFSIFYGLYGNYWFKMLGERRSPVLTDFLQTLGYKTGIFAATRITFPEFDRTCFAAVPYSDIYDQPEGDKAAKDRKITEKALEFINKNGKERFFAFIFYDSPHGSYDYPKEMEKFVPSAAGVEHLLLSPEKIKPVFNKYKNSVRFADSLAGGIIKELKRNKLLENTVIIVTGDHGEPFFERGYYGHNQNYSDYEIKVPLVLYVPGEKGAETNELTSHLDLAPTLMKLIGVKNPSSDYSNGRDLINEREAIRERPFVTAFSWDSAAIITRENTVSFPLESYGFKGIKFYDSDFRETKNKNLEKSFAPMFLEFSRESARFYK